MPSHKSNRKKYNFNLPKRAPAPYGYDKDDTLESWEFENNTSDLMIFKTDYFDPTTYINDEGDVLPNWRKDFEARFPSDEWLNIDILQEFVSFVVSTDRDKATGDTLPSPVTYEDVTYTTDSADYRLAKFRAEFPTYAVLDSFLFYYIFTELFLMVDSRAKNLFIGFNGENVTVSGRKAKRKATAQPYDMDTAAGTNNEGSLVFSYNLEDTDTLAGGANIFNGQYSTLWCNIRDAYSAEIIQMYQRLRSAGTLSYSTVEQRYEDHQSKWCEAIWMEDAWFKYIDPLISPDAGKEPTAVYLPMMQGSKEEQRKWWLINRFKYMDSKWNAGDALSQVIQLRGYAKANITVTPYFDIYPTARYGGYLVKERGEHNKPSELVCPIDTLNDTEIYIYSAPQLKSVGDLAPLKVGFADFSMATRLQNIKIGDSSASYENTNLYSLSLGSNKLLKTLDVRNCSGLGDTSLEGHTQTTVDLSGCEIIEEVYFDGTKIQGVTLPNGGVLRTLSLPSTITNLVVRNQNKIQTFAVENNDYSNITTLRIENCSSAIPVLDILSEIPTNSRVRLIGFTTSVNSTTEVEDFYDYLDTMRGLDESGGNVDTAQVSGTITGLQNITGAWLAEMNARYPFITIEYEHITSNLYYYNYDGTTLLNTETIVDGGNGTYNGTPSRTATAQYTFTFVGWSLEQDAQTADSNATKNVSADRNVYAAYSRTLRSYTVYWRNVDNTLLETDTNVNYDSMPQYNGATPTYQGRTSIGWSPSVSSVVGDVTYTATYVPTYQVNFYNDNGTTLLQTVTVEERSTAVYTGATPTSSEDASLEWLGWATSKNAHKADAVLTNIQSNMTVYAAFKSAVEVAEITDSWDTIINNIDNGTYSTKYKVGNYKPLDLGTEGTINMQIVAMDADELASGGTAPLTFIAMELLATIVKYNSFGVNKVKQLLDNTVYPLLSSSIKTRLQRVIKHSAVYQNANSISSEILWIPSARELNDSNAPETFGVKYDSVYKDDNSRIKSIGATTNAYWTRSGQINRTGYQKAVLESGSFMYSANSESFGVCLGFCLGLESETITDDWSTILANESPSTSYSIGDTKMLDLGTEGKHLMEIVAFDEDDKADGTGKAKITWISKDLLATTHKMNPTKVTNTEGTGTLGGWEKSEMRTYLKETIKPLIPETVRNAIVPVTKISNAYQASNETAFQQTTVDDVWIPGHREVFNSTSYDKTGAVYSDKFKDASSRIKKQNGSASFWWLRSAYNASDFRYVYGSGYGSYYSANYAYGVALGFCTN